jgi:(p)ppGpp synthase/HD superfamily hydrolase
MSSYKPFLSRRFYLALDLAVGLHHSQCGKGTKIPYIAHLMSVCAIVLGNGGDEDLAIAALLHDAVEDQGGRPTLACSGPHIWMAATTSDMYSANHSRPCLYE